MHKLFIIIFAILACCSAIPFKETKLLHKASTLNQHQIYELANLADLNHMHEVFDKIAIPRVVGTPGHKSVNEYIKSSLKNLGWTIETDNFSSKIDTFGELQFENIIAKLNPNAKRFLTLACHYDSLYKKDYDFIGAIDSAVPCTQLINLAKTMDKYLKTCKNNDLSLMFIFFDGEESFADWKEISDSLYGSKHLAAEWNKAKYTFEGEKGITDLDRMDMLILLDLIGEEYPNFFNFYANTTEWFSMLSKIEVNLASVHMFKNYAYGNKEKKYFQDAPEDAASLLEAALYIDDDHVPFRERGVRIVHMIPMPFSDSWHTPNDNKNLINWPTVENINKILRIFVASYLHVQM